MSVTSDKKHHYKTINKTCFYANTIYLIIHVFYLILFIISKLNILIIIDAAIIAIYLLFFLLIKKRKYYLYALLCGNLFFGFIIAATLLIGFNSAFHFYLIGLTVVSFFTTYFSKAKDTKNSIIWAGLSLAIYLTLFFVTRFNDPYYFIDEWLEITLFTTHAVGVFAFISIYLVVFVRYAKNLEKRIMSESRTDELTQINNRYGLFDYFEQEEDKDSKVIALFDIDDFKNINDIYGHVTGDFVLKRVAEIATEVLSDAFVCRYGGEEFVAVLEEKTALDRLEQLRTAIEKEEFAFENNTIHLTATIGAAKYRENISLERWIEMADEKMYFGKNNGKNKTVY